MKLRIKGNSIRFRLNKSDVQQLSSEGYLEECTHFGNATFTYAIQSDEANAPMHARLETNKIILQVPETFVKGWPENDEVGLKGNMILPDGEDLRMLVEKDFVCLDDTEEDQSDNYQNPNSICK
jgi:hypothetical protein